MPSSREELERLGRSMEQAQQDLARTRAPGHPARASARDLFGREDLYDRLSGTERGVVRLLRLGMTSEQVAGALGMTTRSVTNARQLATKRLRAAAGYEAELSERQVDVLDLASRGLGIEASAERLGITQKTLQHHRERIKASLGAIDLAHAIGIAFRRGILR